MEKKIHCFKAMTALFIVSLLLTAFLSAAPAWAIEGEVVPGDENVSVSDDMNDALNMDDQATDRDDLTAKVLEALNNKTYTDTLENLKNGERIISGSYSYTVGGLQQFLVDFTCNISIDGYAGPATFDAVNRVLETFGMDPVEEVDADVFVQLLDLYLIAMDEENAYNILYDHYTEGNESRFYYLRACSLVSQEKYFSAQENFLKSLYGDYEERAAACEQPRPDSGELWHNNYMYSNAMYLVFTVNSYDEDSAMYFEIYTYDNTLASILFLNGSGTVYTGLPGGVYYIKDCTGNTWYGMNEAFGRYGNYEYMEFYEYDDYPYLTNLAAGYRWTISVNVEAGTGTGVGSDSYDWDSWISE